MDHGPHRRHHFHTGIVIQEFAGHEESDENAESPNGTESDELQDVLPRNKHKPGEVVTQVQGRGRGVPQERPQGAGDLQVKMMMGRKGVGVAKG